jgi:hypothetical protein
MNYSRKQLYALGEPFGDGATKKKLDGGVIAGGGGSSSAPAAPAQQSVTQSNIPDWAIPYATQTLGKAQALTDTAQNPYQQYQGERIAGFSPLQEQAFKGVQAMQPNAAVSAGITSAQDAAQRAAANQPYQAATFGNQYQGPQFQNMGLGYLSAGTRDFTDPGVAQSYMSPYQQNVTEFQKQQAIQDFGRQLPGMGAATAQANAFGGNRASLMRAEGQRNLQNQLAGIQATGTQAAYGAGQQAFMTDQARQLQAQLANQGAFGQMQGLGAQQNLAANQQALQNAQLAAQYGLAGQQAAEQSRQYGAGLGLQNLQQQLAAAGMLGNLGQTQYAQTMGINAAQQQAGAQQQAQAQQALTQSYQDFLNQQRYPYQQLGFMSDILRGTPATASSQTIYQAPPSALSQFGGAAQLGLGALLKYGPSATGTP